MIQVASIILRALAAAIVAASARDETPKYVSPDALIAMNFHPPFRLKGGDEIINTENPGYACPCLADIDRDGKPDLLVGQFAGGKIRVYKGLGEMKFGPGEWLKADGEVALVPGIW
jgi:hypothetical protein